jgi:hypothetical protein
VNNDFSFFSLRFLCDLSVLERSGRLILLRLLVANAPRNDITAVLTFPKTKSKAKNTVQKFDKEVYHNE